MTPLLENSSCLVNAEGSSRPHATRIASPTATELEAVLTTWWQELIGVEQVSPQDDFFELGGHSLIGVALFARIKKRYAIELGLSTLFEARTVSQLAELLDGRLQANHSEVKAFGSIVPIQASGTRLPVFWIPGGYGTSVLAFKDVSLLLGTDQPVYGFETPMPEPNQEMESIAARAARFVAEMRILQPQGPYYLLGFCGGGYVAFEMAQQLASSGQRVDLLGIIECYDERHPDTWSGKVRFRAERMVWRLGKFLERGPKGIFEWASLQAKRCRTRLLGRPLSELPASDVDIYEKARRNVDRYQPAIYPGKSLVLIAEDTYDFCGLSRSVDPRLIWCKLSKGGSVVRTVPGDHLEILQPPAMHRLAEEIKRYLPCGAR
jgi:thioesterase domain-containing protein/acyl carrier protein